MAPSLFTRTPGPINDLKELAVGAESKGLVIRIAKRNNGRERPSPLLYNTGAFLAFVAYSERGSDAFLNSTFIIASCPIPVRAGLIIGNRP
jgi:hypothetical protein